LSELDPAPGAVAADVPKHANAIFDLEEPMVLVPKAERTQDSFPIRFDCLTPTDDLLIEQDRVVPLHVGVQEGSSRLKITSVERLKASADDLHVPRRHRLPPLFGEPFGGCAGLVDVEIDRDPLDQASRPQRDE
jgi:hypothetical protein